MVISSGSRDALGVRIVRDPGLLRPLIQFQPQFQFAIVIMHDVSMVVYYDPSRGGLARVSIHLVDELSAGLIGTLGDERRA